MRYLRKKCGPVTGRVFHIVFKVERRVRVIGMSHQLARSELKPVHNLLWALELADLRELLLGDHPVRQQLEHVQGPPPHIPPSDEAEYERLEISRKSSLAYEFPQPLHPRPGIVDIAVHVCGGTVKEGGGVSARD